MKRRDFVKLGCAAAVGASATRLLPAQMPAAQMPAGQMPPETSPADFTLRIAPVLVELAPRRAISTIGYNGTAPGPVLRMREGKAVTVDVINDTDVPELVHWHGQLIPSAVDGSEEEGTPLVPPRGRRRYQFVPHPAGTRWYHTHAMAGNDLHQGVYTGQFGFVFIESGDNPGRYDQELFLALREWEPFFTDTDNDEDPDPRMLQPEKPATPDTRPNGWEIGYRAFSINDRSLGGGDPIQVRQGQRVLMHFLNASPTTNRRIALPAHRFQIVALDGNPVPSPQLVDAIELGPGERADAYVEMNQPGVWILGATQDDDRNGGMGVFVEYANQKGDIPWIPPPKTMWDYNIFGRAATPRAPDHTIELLIEKIAGGPGKFNHWTLNGKEYPHEGEYVLQQGARYRLVFRNRTDDAHPVHLHRHLFELVEFNGKATSGVIKDTVMVPMYGRVVVDFVADQPGLTLFHCHNQIHMDFGFKALFRYS
jgi:FtsP/CotA-like multicopper oxidase with cupredoxin domain